MNTVRDKMVKLSIIGLDRVMCRGCGIYMGLNRVMGVKGILGPVTQILAQCVARAIANLPLEAVPTFGYHKKYPNQVRYSQCHNVCKADCYSITYSQELAESRNFCSMQQRSVLRMSRPCEYKHPAWGDRKFTSGFGIRAQMPINLFS